ncbi:MAG: sigma-54 dependent transcriptional regulator [Gammaproteobacteria bacterium]|nr:sigma-54 dependent transcriptional regulator [Gammaproteobacteria bacterium]
MRKILVSWIGHTDLRAPQESEVVGVGPVAQALMAGSYDDVFLLTDHEEKAVDIFIAWLLAQRYGCVLHVLHERLTGPTEFGEIYTTAVRACETALAGNAEDASLTFHLSPGTPAMAAVWIILAKTRFPAELIESSRQHGVRTASVPFDISADYLPDLLRQPDRELERLSAGLPPEAPEFDAIVHSCRVMQRAILRARRVAPRSVPVLIEGETGTGKELMARAIHRASPRRERPFIAVNCGALPPELVESELFGHEKGAFTGADRMRKGYFEAAGGGTLFLDEIGELPALAQVKLLRVLQEGEVVRVGATKSLGVDVRVVAATNRTLTQEITEGRFREDLYYRLAVAVLKLPPLRERPGDVGPLVDRLLDQINEESAHEPGFRNKKLSASARNVLIRQSWPGNVRELLNTLRRAAIWSDGTTIETEDVREALLPVPRDDGDRVLDRALGNGFSLPDLLANVARHYLARAMEEAAGNKSRAAELVGLASYQTLTNWLSKYGVSR